MPIKRYSEQFNVGTVRYVVNFTDGSQRHRDGSPFYDVKLFSNQRKKNAFIRDLERQGYTREH